MTKEPNLGAGGEGLVSPPATPYDDAVFLRTVLESVPAYVVRLDSDLRITYINRLQPGFRLEEVLGRSTFDFVEPAYHAEHAAAIEQARTTGRGTSYVVHAKGASGQLAYYESHFVPIAGASGGQELTCIALEITEHIERAEALRQSEEKLRLAVEKTGLGLWDWDMRTDRVDWNERMHEITGSPVPLGPQAYITRVVHPEDRARIEREWRHVAEAMPEYPVHRILRSDGAVRWVLTFGNQHRNDKGELTHMTGGMIDVTSQRQIDEHLRAVQKMDAIGALTAGVAHNFNNMLAVIIPAIELSLRTASGAEHEALGGAAHAARRAADLVTQLMTFAGQRKSTQHGPIEVGDVVRRAVSMCERAFDRQIVLETSIAEGPLRVSGDAAGLEQVVVNALINARDAVLSAKRPEPRIAVRVWIASSTAPEESQAERVCITIEDNGIGMTDAVKRRLFEPFFTTKPPGKGTGLGLSTSYAIVREHNGLITYDSRAGVGTTCEILLPCEGQTTTAARREVPEAKTAARARVMVIDDEPGVRSIVAQALSMEGHDVLLAAGGEEAIALLRSTDRPDLILLDRSMPGWPPERSLAAIRALAPHVPVLFFTGEDVPAAQRALVQGVLQKPLSLAELAAGVARFTGPRQ